MASMFIPRLRRAKHFCPNARIKSVYGSTEAEPMAEIALSDISQTDFEAMERGKGLLAGRCGSPKLELRPKRAVFGRAVLNRIITSIQHERLRRARTRVHVERTYIYIKDRRKVDPD
jgi:hypothetical protein